MEKQLRRIKKQAVLGGVAAGVGKYFNVDLVLVRLLFVVSLFISFGVSLFAYVVLWVILPEEPGSLASVVEDRPVPYQYPTQTAEQPSGNVSDRNLKVIAVGLIAVGAYMLVDQYIPWYSLGKFIWPVGLIALGAFLLLRKRDRDLESSDEKPDSTPPPSLPEHMSGSGQSGSVTKPGDSPYDGSDQPNPGN